MCEAHEYIRKIMQGRNLQRVFLNCSVLGAVCVYGYVLATGVYVKVQVRHAKKNIKPHTKCQRGE